MMLCDVTFCDVTFCAMMGLVLRAMPFHSTISIDEKLLERLNNQKTREVAFGEFYDALSRHVYMYALRMTSCPSEASDITQETFIRIHSHLCRGYTITDPLPFCLLIARQRVLNVLRDQKLDIDLEEHHIVVDPYVEIERADLMRHVEHAIGKLPVMLRDAFVLRYYDGLSYDAISDMINEQPGTIRMRVQRAKSMLRAELVAVRKEVR
jgi:RNA polymerase sigma-70 factor (ECF subfamily)